MNMPVSYCGLLCEGCPIFWATHETDELQKKKMKVEIARLSNEIYATNLTANDITGCEGCKAEDAKIFEGCLNCKIRNCCIEKQFSNCAYCDNYPCEYLQELFKESNDSKTRLDFIRSIL